MNDGDLKEYLRGILVLLGAQAIDLDRHHCWISSVADTIATDAVLGPLLKQHSLYDLPREPALRSIDDILLAIDAMLLRLKDQD